MSQVKDHIGKKFNSLTVVVRDGNDSRGGARWRCACDCGGHTILTGSAINRGAQVGCKQCRPDRRKKNAAKKLTAEYGSWCAMIARCGNTKSPKWKHYGGRGISVCLAWRESFEQFVRDVGERPSKNHSIDRIDNNGNYEPGNARWATRSMQCRNMRTNRVLDVNGERVLMVDAVDKSGLSYACVRGRLRMGWSPERALNTPLQIDRSSRA